MQLKATLWLFAALMLVVGSSSTSFAVSPVPDTGQTTCYDNTTALSPCPLPGENFYGQDASYTINPPSYTKLDENGHALADDAVEWVMVRDNVTGLIWEVKTDDGGIHDKNNTYTWADATDVFITQLNADKFGGCDNWRMPNVNELESIMDYGHYNPCINTNYFPHTLSLYYCSYTTYAGDINDAWYPDFLYGADGADFGHMSKLLNSPVRAVSGKQLTQSFTDNGDGTVTDNITGLMWMQTTFDMNSDGAIISDDDAIGWQQAIALCENLSLGGYDDWRLPTLKELRSIVNFNTKTPAIDTQYFPDTNGGPYWSSTTNAEDTTHARRISFVYGNRNHRIKTWPACARAVRGGQCPPTADAGDSRDVLENTVVMLDGSDSYDPDGYIMSYLWSQTDGPTVTLSSPFAIKPSFLVPAGVVGQTLTFALSVTDNAGVSNIDNVILTITADACTTQPNKPVLIAPTNGATSVSLTPILKSGPYSDPGSCSTHFKTRWQISDQADFSGLTYNANTFDDQPTSHQVTKKVLKPDTTYYWRVKYWGDHGIKSEWSDVFTFTTVSDNRDGNGDGVPDSQEAPPGSDINENGTPDENEIDLRSMITENGTDNIGLKFSKDIVSIAVETMCENEISSLENMTGELPYGLMAFRVKTANLGATVSFTVHLQDAAPDDAVWYKQDNVNGWYDFTPNVTFSPNRKSVTFTLTDGGKGDADGFVNGVIVDPAGLGINVRPLASTPGTPNNTASVDQASPMFTWDAVAGADYYYLIIQNQFQKSIFNQRYLAADVDNGDGTCTVTPRVTLAPGDYFWLVRAENEYGLGLASDKTAFTVETTQVPPVTPTLNTPTGTIADTTPTFDWDEVANADYYYLIIQNQFQKTIFNKKYLSSAVNNGDGTCTINPGKTLAAGDYYWLVRARNQYGLGPASARMAFTVE